MAFSKVSLKSMKLTVSQSEHKQQCLSEKVPYLFAQLKQASKCKSASFQDWFYASNW